MPASSQMMYRFRPALGFLIVAITLALSLPALAQGTHLWTQSKLEEFEKGTPQGESPPWRAMDTFARVLG